MFSEFCCCCCWHLLSIRRLFKIRKEAGSVNTVPYAGRYGLDGRFYAEEIKPK